MMMKRRRRRIGSRLMDLIVEDVKGKCKAQPRDMLRMAVNHSSLDIPKCIPFTKAQDLTGDIVMSQIERVLQSNKDVIDGDMPLEMTHTILTEELVENAYMLISIYLILSCL